MSAPLEITLEEFIRDHLPHLFGDSSTTLTLGGGQEIYSRNGVWHYPPDWTPPTAPLRKIPRGVLLPIVAKHFGLDHASSTDLQDCVPPGSSDFLRLDPRFQDPDPRQVPDIAVFPAFLYISPLPCMYCIQHGYTCLLFEPRKLETYYMQPTIHFDRVCFRCFLDKVGCRVRFDVMDSDEPRDVETKRVLYQYSDKLKRKKRVPKWLVTVERERGVSKMATRCEPYVCDCGAQLVMTKEELRLWPRAQAQIPLLSPTPHSSSGSGPAGDSGQESMDLDESSGSGSTPDVQAKRRRLGSSSGDYPEDYQPSYQSTSPDSNCGGSSGSHIEQSLKQASSSQHSVVEPNSFSPTVDFAANSDGADFQDQECVDLVEPTAPSPADATTMELQPLFSSNEAHRDSERPRRKPVPANAFSLDQAEKVLNDIAGSDPRLWDRGIAEHHEVLFWWCERAQTHRDWLDFPKIYDERDWVEEEVKLAGNIESQESLKEMQDDMGQWRHLSYNSMVQRTEDMRDYDGLPLFNDVGYNTANHINHKAAPHENNAREPLLSSLFWLHLHRTSTRRMLTDYILWDGRLDPLVVVMPQPLVHIRDAADVIDEEGLERAAEQTRKALVMGLTLSKAHAASGHLDSPASVLRELLYFVSPIYIGNHEGLIWGRRVIGEEDTSIPYHLQLYLMRTDEEAAMVAKVLSKAFDQTQLESICPDLTLLQVENITEKTHCDIVNLEDVSCCSVTPLLLASTLVYRERLVRDVPYLKFEHCARKTSIMTDVERRTFLRRICALILRDGTCLEQSLGSIRADLHKRGRSSL